jgi:hypothetical protein
MQLIRDSGIVCNILKLNKFPTNEQRLSLHWIKMTACKNFRSVGKSVSRIWFESHTFKYFAFEKKKVSPYFANEMMAHRLWGQ